jgi:hypothetical protein
MLFVARGMVAREGSAPYLIVIILGILFIHVLFVSIILLLLLLLLLGTILISVRILIVNMCILGSVTFLLLHLMDLVYTICVCVVV